MAETRTRLRRFFFDTQHMQIKLWTASNNWCYMVETNWGTKPFSHFLCLSQRIGSEAQHKRAQKYLHIYIYTYIHNRYQNRNRNWWWSRILAKTFLIKRVNILPHNKCNATQRIASHRPDSATPSPKRVCLCLRVPVSDRCLTHNLPTASTAAQSQVSCFPLRAAFHPNDDIFPAPAAILSLLSIQFF